MATIPRNHNVREDKTNTSGYHPYDEGYKATEPGARQSPGQSATNSPAETTWNKPPPGPHGTGYTGGSGKRSGSKKGGF